MPKRIAPPGSDGDKSDWINYAMQAHGAKSYEAWDLTLDELKAQYAPKPPPKSAPPVKKEASRG